MKRRDKCARRGRSVQSVEVGGRGPRGEKHGEEEEGEGEERGGGEGCEGGEYLLIPS